MKRDAWVQCNGHMRPALDPYCKICREAMRRVRKMEYEVDGQPILFGHDAPAVVTDAKGELHEVRPVADSHSRSGA